MKAAYVLSATPGLFGRVKHVLMAQGAEAGNDAVRLEVEGRLLTVHPIENDGRDKFDREEPPTAIHGVGPPHVPTASVCSFECRWEELFTETVKGLDRRLDQDVLWVLDGDGVLWSATSLDSQSVTL